MTETRQDFDVWTGNTVQITDDVSGQSVDNHDVEFRLFPYKGGEETMKKTTTDDPSDVVVVDSSTIRVTLDGSDTDSLPVRGEEEFYYRIDVIDGQGDEYTVTTGHIRVHD